uniref:Dynein axonemal assembly factor 1 homolog n=1 Tax=Anopheles christyi TaxID=43041 RepID=A0A182JVY8_9DIPT
MVREQYEEEFGPKKMTKKTIQASCRKNKLYLTPHLNDVLYLHYSGYNAIDGLEEYVGLKCLWLECNAISNISGLDHQSQLRCLYLHNNLIKKIENLEHCKQLDTLNLSHNHIAKIENCGSDILPMLNTLNISHNYLKSIESLAELRKCDFVSVLDISHNRIDDIAIVKVLADMKGLRVLTMVGNPVVNDIPSYRKTLILECKTLTYLDSRPVFDKDRACAEAWKRGGYEEERREHLRFKKEEQRKMRRSINATLRLRHRGDGEPELLKTSSDEEEEDNAKESPMTGKDELKELEYQSNDVAWKEMEELFNQHTSALKPAPNAYATDQPRQLCEAIEKCFGGVNTDQCINESIRKPLIEEITTEVIVNRDDNDSHRVVQEAKDDLETLEQGTEIDESYMSESAEKDDLKIVTEPAHENELQEEMHNPEHLNLDEILRGDAKCDAANKHSSPNPSLEDKKLPEMNRKTEARIASAEQDDTLNVIIQSKEISITMQPTCSTTKQLPSDPLDTVVQGDDRKGSTASVDSITSNNPKIGDERKASTNSVDYITGSDSNSDPTLVTDCDSSCVRNSSLACSSRSDTSSDSEDMFDKIVPKKHRKLACTMRPEVSLSSSDSETADEGGSLLDGKLDHQNTITEFIDEYKRFFHSVDLRDPKCVLKNRHKIVRPQTAKAQRTEPIVVYEGVLKAMEQSSNGAKLEQVRQERKERNERSLAKEAVLERLMKGHGEVDMNIEQQMISIGGKQHNFNEYRLEVFRQDQEKLQHLIDRVTAQKDKYNAHIDSIHDQLANIMEDYGQISEKLRKVDDMIQNIGEEVHQEKEVTFLNAPNETHPRSIAEQIVENMTKEPDVVEVNVDPLHQTSSDESGADLCESTPHVAAQIEVGLSDPTDPTVRQPIQPEEFRTDPVYRKFIDIQYEIDKLTEDQIFTALSEAARELREEEEELEAKLLHDAVDEYWTTDLDDFRRNLNLDAHPIIQRFKRFIDCQAGTDTDDTDSEAHVRKLETAYQRYERRLSNHLFDEYLMLSRKASIATTTGGESSATELELIEIEGGHVLRASTSRRTTAWDLKETLVDPVAEVEELNEDELDKGAGDSSKHEELEDEESRPEVVVSAQVTEVIEDIQGDH